MSFLFSSLVQSFMTCGCVGPVVSTVLHRDRRRQHGPFYPGRRLSQYRFLIVLTHSGCFGQYYFQTLSRGLARYSVVQFIPFIPAGHSTAVVVVVAEKKFSHPTMGGVIRRLGTLPELWESENMPEDLRRS